MVAAAAIAPLGQVAPGLDDGAVFRAPEGLVPLLDLRSLIHDAGQVGRTPPGP